MIDPLTFFRRELFCMRQAAYLELIGRAGAAGVSQPIISGTMGEVASTVLVTCRKLERMGLLEAPVRDRRARGAPNHWKISAAGAALLSCQTAVTWVCPRPKRKLKP